MLLSYTREDGPEICQDGNYIEHPLLQRGVLWGIGRMSVCNPLLMLQKGAGQDVVPYLLSDDVEIRGLAAWTAGALRVKLAREALEVLAKDHRAFSLYQEGYLQATTVATLAQTALKELDKL